MDYPNPSYVLAQTFSDFIEDKKFQRALGYTGCKVTVTDVESAAHGFARFETGQVLSFQVLAEMNKREEVSASFSEKAGGMIRRLFGTDGLDETAIDTAICMYRNMEVL